MSHAAARLACLVLYTFLATESAAGAADSSAAGAVAPVGAVATDAPTAAPTPPLPPSPQPSVAPSDVPSPPASMPSAAPAPANPVVPASPAPSPSPAPATPTPPSGNFALGPEFGTFGFGFTAAAAVIPQRLDLRVDNGIFTYGFSGNSNGFSYNGTLHLSSFDVALDAHPVNNPFRLTAGVVLGGNHIDIDGVPGASQTFYLNGHPYSAEDIGSVIGKATFGGGNPFFGIGYGSASGRRNSIGLVVDLGVLLEPAASVTIGTSKNELPPSAQAQLISDLQQAKVQLQNNLTIVRTYPVARIGLQFVF